MTLKLTHDLAIIGSGPAGMAAAVEGSKLGLRCVLITESPTPGGRIYHALNKVQETRPEDMALFGADYSAGKNLISDFILSNVHVHYNAPVFRLDGHEDGGSIWFLKDGQATSIHVRRVLIATGAMERPVPLPGWALPGVLSVGAAQLLLKGDNMIPDGPVVIAGCGPLLLLGAQQLIQAGAQIDAIVETTTLADHLSALPALPQAFPAREYLLKGLKLRRGIKKSGVPIYSAASGLQIKGDTQATGLTFHQGRKLRHIPADTILLHNGVVPDTQLTRQAGCDHIWHKGQRCWVPQLSPTGQTSLPSLFVAGDGGGIGGAVIAACHGHISAIQIAQDLGILDQAQAALQSRPWLKQRNRHQTIRPFLENLFKPALALIAPPDDKTIVCRCEEVTAGDIRQAAKLGCAGPNQLKAFTRAGMGPCQGRMCGLSISEILAQEHKTTPAQIGYFTIRPPVKPVTLGQLAALDEDALS